MTLNARFAFSLAACMKLLMLKLFVINFLVWANARCRKLSDIKVKSVKSPVFTLSLGVLSWPNNPSFRGICKVEKFY